MKAMNEYIRTRVFSVYLQTLALRIKMEDKT